MATVTASEREDLNALGYSDFIISGMTDELKDLILSTNSVAPYSSVRFEQAPPSTGELFLEGVGRDVEEIGISVASTVREIPETVANTYDRAKEVIANASDTVKILVVLGVVGLLMFRK